MPLPFAACLRTRYWPWPFLAMALLLGGCAGLTPAGRAGAGGPPAQTPDTLEPTPNAVPRIEPLRVGGPNKPYVVRGVRYEPMTTDAPWRERGGASWYGRAFHGRSTASGETFDMFAMSAAHKTMPLPSYARVRNPANGREIVVRVNDRGPFVPGRVIDLSYAAARQLGVLDNVTPVEVERITHDEIRTGLRLAAPEDAGLPGPAAAAAGFWLQLGAFRDRTGALQLQRLLQQETPWLAERLVLQDDSTWVRVRAGPWPQKQDAEAAAARLADALPLQALVVRVP